MIIESLFKSQERIPTKYTCEGANLSPPLKFLDVPSLTKSLVLIVDDPDAPRGTFDHWIVWNLPPEVKELSEGAPELKRISSVKQGLNGYQQCNYKGPCPPPGGRHHYHFKLYALDTLLNLPEASSKQTVEQAMEGHILDHSELIGTYQR